METTYSYQIDNGSAEGFTAFFGIILIVALAVSILAIAGMWKSFTKAGRPGWAALIPIYNLYIILDISGKPTWWLLWFLLPILPIPILNGILGIVSLVFNFIVMIAFAEKYGKGPGFGVGLVLLNCVFFPILGFGSSEYLGGNEENQQAPPLPQVAE